MKIHNYIYYMYILGLKQICLMRNAVPRDAVGLRFAPPPAIWCVIRVSRCKQKYVSLPKSKIVFYSMIIFYHHHLHDSGTVLVCFSSWSMTQIPWTQWTFMIFHQKMQKLMVLVRSPAFSLTFKSMFAYVYICLLVLICGKPWQTYEKPKNTQHPTWKQMATIPPDILIFSFRAVASLEPSPQNSLDRSIWRRNCSRRPAVVLCNS